MKRWIQYDLPVFVLVECGNQAHTGEVHAVVATADPAELYPARSGSGAFLIYDEDLRCIDDQPSTQAQVLSVAEQRNKWPTEPTWAWTGKTSHHPTP